MSTGVLLRSNVIIRDIESASKFITGLYHRF